MQGSQHSMDSQTFHNQLREAKRIVLEATEALLHQSHLSPPNNQKDVTSTSSSPDSSSALLPTATSTDASEHADIQNDDDLLFLQPTNMTPQEEFQLAMRLFSSDPLVMEQELQRDLSRVQESLSNLMIPKYEAGANDGDNDDTMGELMMTATATSEELASQAKDIRGKIEFLSWCNEAKLAIDSTCMSYYRYATEEEDGDEEKDGLSWNRHEKSWLMHCAERLVVARDALKKAGEILKRTRGKEEDEHAMSKGLSESDERVVGSVLKSIESQWSMRALNVCYDAMQVMQECVQIQGNAIEICVGNALVIGRHNGGDKMEGHGHGNGAEFHDFMGHNHHNNKSEAAEEGIQTAMAALAMLSFGNESKFDKLEQLVVELAEHILSMVLRPAIEAVREGLENKEKVTVEYDVVESTVEKSSRLGVGGKGLVGSKTLHNKKKINVKMLQWTDRRSSMGARENNVGRDTQESSVGDALMWWIRLIELIQKVMQFMCDKVMDQVEDAAVRNEMYCIFGKTILGNVPRSKTLQSVSLDFDITEYGTQYPIVKLLGKLAWDHCVPSEVNKEAFDTLDNCSRVLKDSISSFDSFLMDRHLTDQHIALSQYVDNIHQIYCDKVRMHVLAKGRKILVEGDYHNSIKVGVNLYEKKKRETPEYLDQLGIEKQDMSIFIFEECGISQVASELMELSKQTMDLAVEELTALHRLLPPTLYRATRELFDLYHAIIPTVHSSEIETIPRIAAVFHNDCCYFAHKLLTFGLEYKDRFPSDSQGKESGLKHLCTFLDLVPIFREIAERAMNDIVGYQKNQIVDIVNPRLEYFKEALGSNEGVVEWADAETALTAGLYHLRHLSRAWKPILPRQVYLISMGSIVDHFLNLFLEKVFAAKDISVQACQFVNSLFQSGLRGVVEVFGSSMGDLLEGTKDAEKSCSVYHKFAAVEKFMNMGIADINMALPEGTFRSMTGAELSRLVLAVFEDTNARRKLLRVLESS